MDIAGYASRGVGGALLVLGAGTGRVCRGLASLRPVTGLDLSPDMIARARERGPASVTWVVGDMVSFDKDHQALGPFAEVIVPNAAFAFLPDRAARSACLLACRRTLTSGAPGAAGGPLTIDLPMPDAALLGQPHTPERLAWEGTLDGRIVRRTREVFRAPVAQTLRLVDRFWLDGDCFAVSELRLHLFSPDEVQWMLEACGFYVDEVWGDHLGGPLREGCDRLLVRALPL